MTTLPDTIADFMKAFRPSLIPALLAMALLAPLTARSAPEEVATTGTRFVDLISKGDFAGAETNFDPTMKSAMPEARLRETWQTVQAQAGPFQEQLGARAIKLAGYDAALVTCQFEHTMLDVKVVFDAQGRVSGLFFLASEGFIDVSAMPPYARTNLFREREFTVNHGQWHLPGTLTMPDTGVGPWPAVVLVHGSGPEDRDETGGANKPFRDLAWGLASKGIAVLRYENRTEAYAAMFRRHYPARFTVKDETIDDALAAVDQLGATDGIDPKRIFVLGHSLGGMLAPKIGQVDTNIAGLIMLAGATRPFEEVIVEQTRYLISLNGKPTAEQEAYLADVQSDATKVKNLSAADASSSVILFGAQPAYWLDLREYDVLATAKELTQPMLILQGGRDYQVTGADFDRWKAALGGQSGVVFKLYPKLNHQFIAGEGKSTPDEYQLPGHVEEEVVTDIAGWINGFHAGSGAKK
jgi:fermentation-respiration switch protein FrsA (DUF1100 family)